MTFVDLHLNQESKYTHDIIYLKRNYYLTVHTKGLEAITNSGTRSAPSVQIVVSKYHFHKKNPEILGEMADFGSGAINLYKPRTSCHAKKQRSCTHSQVSCQEIINSQVKGTRSFVHLKL